MFDLHGEIAEAVVVLGELLHVRLERHRVELTTHEPGERRLGDELGAEAPAQPGVVAAELDPAHADDRAFHDVVDYPRVRRFRPLDQLHGGEGPARVAVLPEDRRPPEVVGERVHRVALADGRERPQLVAAEVVGPLEDHVLDGAAQLGQVDEHGHPAVRLEHGVEADAVRREPAGRHQAADVLVGDRLVVGAAGPRVHHGADLLGRPHLRGGDRDHVGDRPPDRAAVLGERRGAPGQRRGRHDGDEGGPAPAAVAAGGHRASPRSRATRRLVCARERAIRRWGFRVKLAAVPADEP